MKKSPLIKILFLIILFWLLVVGIISFILWKNNGRFPTFQPLNTQQSQSNSQSNSNSEPRLTLPNGAQDEREGCATVNNSQKAYSYNENGYVYFMTYFDSKKDFAITYPKESFEYLQNYLKNKPEDKKVDKLNEAFFPGCYDYNSIVIKQADTSLTDFVKNSASVGYFTVDKYTSVDYFLSYYNIVQRGDWYVLLRVTSPANENIVSIKSECEASTAEIGNCIVERVSTTEEINKFQEQIKKAQELFKF
ncbi:MAG: hypothetical protein ACRCXZ_09995 [Patescibacteria group bacterium]